MSYGATTSYSKRRTADSGGRTPHRHAARGMISPLLANIYLSVLDRHFQQVWVAR
jgi:hypothetical protein